MKANEKKQKQDPPQKIQVFLVTRTKEKTFHEVV